MRLLHTADWHIGQTLNGWGREAEHGAFLAALPDLVEAHDVDALIVAGDVFDGINPSAESMQLLYEALLALHARRPHLEIVMVAGNHDPAWRLEAPASLLRRIGVHVVGVMHRRDGVIDLARHLVPLRDGMGEVRGHVLAIPYLRPTDLPGLAQDMGEGVAQGGPSPVVSATRRLYEEAVGAARGAAGGLPLLATGHLHCTGAVESEGAERRILVGGEHAVPHTIFPDALSYVALGHLHRPQSVGRDAVRYSGSPFPLSASELDTEHGVTLVEVADGRVRTQHIPVARPVPCIRLPAVGGVPIAGLQAELTALELDAALPVPRRPFVHLVLAADGPAAGLAGEAEQVLERHPVRCGGIRILRPQAVEGAAGEHSSPTALADADPADLFERAFAATHGSAPGPEHRRAFHRALAEE